MNEGLALVGVVVFSVAWIALAELIGRWIERAIDRWAGMEETGDAKR